MGRACVQEVQVALHFVEGRHAEQAGALPNAQELLEDRGCTLDHSRRGLQRSVGQQGLLEAPLVLVLAGDRQADTPVVALPGPIDLVEPVAGVVAVLVHVLGAQQVIPALEERHALPELHQAHRQHVAPYPRRLRVGLRGFDLHHVEDVLVVVHRNIVHRLDGGCCVPGGLPLVVELPSGERHPHCVGEGVVPQVAGKPNADPVGAVQQRGLLIRAGRVLCSIGAGIGKEAGRKALHALVIKRAATTDTITDPVVERSNPVAIQVQLGGIDAQGTVCRLAEVEAFAVDVNLASIDAVLRKGQLGERLLDRLQVADEREAHDVEAETVDLVLLRVPQDRILLQLAHHDVFRRCVGAAAGGQQRAVGIQAVVVVRHHLVKDRVGRFAEPTGVVEDHVLDDAQTGTVQAHHHLPVFLDALIGVDRVGPFRRQVMIRIVAPVVRVGALNGRHRCLLLRAVRRISAQVPGGLPCALVFVHRVEVKGRQKVNGLQSRGGQRAQVLHAIGRGVRKGQVGALVRGRHRAVADGEVPYMQLIDAQVVDPRQPGCNVGRPARGRVDGGCHVGDAALGPIQRKVDRVRVRNDVLHHTAGGGRVYLLGEQVIVSNPLGVQHHDPHTAVFVHRDHAGRRGVCAVGKKLQVHRLGGRRPHFDLQGAGRVVREVLPVCRAVQPVAPDNHAEVAGIGVKVVEHAGILHAGCIGKRSVTLLHRDGQLPLQQRVVR